MAGNTNVTSGQVLPGFYGYVDYNSQGSGVAPSLRTLLWAYIAASAQRTPNRPFLPASQQEADDGCGQGSDAANMYAACVSQPEAQGAEVWIMPIAEPSGGVAAQYKLKVYVASTNPSEAGTLQLWVGSKAIAAVGFTTTDTASTIAAAINAALNAVKDLPLGVCTVATDTVTIPYKHKGTTGEDLPFRCNITPNGCGVQLSPGQLLFAGASATGAGSVKVVTGSLGISTTLAGAETPAQVATKVATSWNADSYPLTAAVDGGVPAQVNFFFANNRDVRRMSAAVLTSTVLTANLGSGATDGSGSPTSLTYNGTQGTGAPDLSAAIANLANLDTFRSWASPWTDTATLSVMATNIEANSDGSISGQRQQLLTVCSFDASSIVGAIAPAVSPNLTSTPPHYAILRAEDAPVQAYGFAARAAAARAAKWFDAPQFNWNGFQFKGNSRSPILLPATKPSRNAQNTDLRTYALAPVVVGPSGNFEIVKGRSTSLSNDKRLWAWSSEAQAAYHAVDLALFFQSRFQGGSILRYSEPKAPGLYDSASFVSATQERMRFWEANGNYDGADRMKDLVNAAPDGNNPFKENVDYPESPVLDLDQVAFAGHFTSPST